MRQCPLAPVRVHSAILSAHRGDILGSGAMVVRGEMLTEKRTEHTHRRIGAQAHRARDVTGMMVDSLLTSR